MQEHEAYYRSVSNLVAEATREGYAPWLSDKKPGEREIPHNPITGQVFNNVNGQYLDLVGAKNGWDDPRWISSTDILAANGAVSLRYGERPSFIASYNKYNHLTLGETTTTEYIPMFNASQVKGLPPYEHGRVTRFTEERRDNYEENTETPFTTSQEVTRLYFKQQQQQGLASAATIEPLARYFLAITTTGSYEAPREDNKEIKNLAYARSPEESLRALYNASVYTNRVTNPGFKFERDAQPRRTVERDSERKISMNHERGMGR